MIVKKYLSQFPKARSDVLKKHFISQSKFPQVLHLWS